MNITDLMLEIGLAVQSDNVSRVYQLEEKTQGWLIADEEREAIDTLISAIIGEMEGRND